MMNQYNDGIRKAAILVAGLDRDAADAILEQMDALLATRVRDYLVEMDDVDEEEQQRVLAEFLRQNPLAASPKHTPSPLQQTAEDEYVSASAADPDAETREAKALHFRFLHEAEDDKLARLLLSERSQTVALVLSHLPPEQAGSVLVKFPAPLQVDVIRRLVDLDETAPEILEEVERALENRVSEHLLRQRRRVAGLSAVAGILGASQRQISCQILSNLNSLDRTLADRLGAVRLSFAELCKLDVSTMREVAASLDPRLLALALLGLPPSMADPWLHALPRDAARQVQFALSRPEPTRLRDVEQARERIADQVAHLVPTGAIGPQGLSFEPQLAAA